MTFNQLVKGILPEVQRGSTDPFIIYRNNEGSWEYDFIKNQSGETFDWLEDVKERDPLFSVTTGYDFANGSLPYVHDQVLCNRLRADYNHAVHTGDYFGAEDAKHRALLNFFEDYVGEFSQETTDYLVEFDRPLAALYKLCPYNLNTEHSGWTFNEDLAMDAVDRIEDAVSDRLNRKKDVVVPQKRLIDGYEEKLSIQLAGRLVIFGENPKSDVPYLVCLSKRDNPLGIEEFYNAAVTDDYLEAMRQFTNELDTLLIGLEDERAAFGTVQPTLTAADCVPKGLDDELAGKLIIIKPDVLSPEYRTADRQLKIVQGGFGARPNARGNAVFCKDLYSGKESRFERYDVLGVADLDRIPEWAKQKLALLEAIKEPGVFEYGGYHFKPARPFRKGEAARHLAGDSRPEKGDAQFAMRNMSSDFELGLRNYAAGEYGAGEKWSYKDFYTAAANSEADIFRCVENGKLYVPGENELFRYNEAPLKVQAKPTPAKKQSLLSALGEAKEEAKQYNAEHKPYRANKRSDKEVD
jgi:hypothetical protein